MLKKASPAGLILRHCFEAASCQSKQPYQKTAHVSWIIMDNKSRSTETDINININIDIK